MSTFPQNLDAGFKVGPYMGEVGLLLVLPAVPDLGQDTCYEIDNWKFLFWLQVKVQENKLLCLYIRQHTYNVFEKKRICRNVAWALQKSMKEIVNGFSVAQVTGVLIDIWHVEPEHQLIDLSGGGEEVALVDGNVPQPVVQPVQVGI